MTSSIWASVDIGSTDMTAVCHYLYVNAEMSAIPMVEADGKWFAVELVGIPEPHRADFEQSLRGRQMPVVEGHGRCAYLADFQEWLSRHPH